MRSSKNTASVIAVLILSRFHAGAFQPSAYRPRALPLRHTCYNGPAFAAIFTACFFLIRTRWFCACATAASEFLVFTQHHFVAITLHAGTKCNADPFFYSHSFTARKVFIGRAGSARFLQLSCDALKYFSGLYTVYMASGY